MARNCVITSNGEQAPRLHEEEANDVGKEGGVVRWYHLIISGYGFWLPNDPRGSWSEFVGAGIGSGEGETGGRGDGVKGGWQTGAKWGAVKTDESRKVVLSYVF